MLHPEAGDTIPGTGGLRKLRFADARRGKGKRGGLRVIYYWWDTGSQFWLFTVFDKDEMADLTPLQRKTLKEMIKKELDAADPDSTSNTADDDDRQESFVYEPSDTSGNGGPTTN